LICHIRAAIESFQCKDTQRLFERMPVRQFGAFEKVARRKLEQLDAAASLDFLRVPPGVDRYSIRINDQFRLCFRWNGADAEDVEIVDYH
jgi:proteic killer suppression protein